MNYADFGTRFDGFTGIGQLMEDLTVPLNPDQTIRMLGGGNPALIPAMTTLFRDSMQTLMADTSRFEDTLCSYGAPGGLTAYTAAISDLLNQHYGWSTTPANIALTNGSQNAFFLLFNLFAGEQTTASGQIHTRKILLPLVPEYIGYGDVSIKEPFFVANKPTIDRLDDQIFKYRIDFDALELTDDIGAVCVSRPTNPTGNVMTDNELDCLMSLTSARGIPLIIDNAYGAPFPNIIHTQNTLRWDENTILTMSLSKLGLPALRTGIVVANEEIVRLLTSMNSVVNLTPGSIGAALTLNMMQSGKIIEYSENVIRPYYQQKAELALAMFQDAFSDLSAFVHKPEGAFFLWMWFPELAITTHELYLRLKSRGVIVVPGHYFFPGLNKDWQHTQECIRVSYASNDDDVAAGISIIAEEVKLASGTL